MRCLVSPRETQSTAAHRVPSGDLETSHQGQPFSSPLEVHMRGWRRLPKTLNPASSRRQARSSFPPFLHLLNPLHRLGNFVRGQRCPETVLARPPSHALPDGRARVESCFRASLVSRILVWSHSLQSRNLLRRFGRNCEFASQTPIPCFSNMRKSSIESILQRLWLFARRNTTPFHVEMVGKEARTPTSAMEVDHLRTTRVLVLGVRSS
jgi:hypothetical protein